MVIENQQIIDVLKETGWILKGRSIIKSYKFEDFMQAMSFVNDVADLAEEKNHHPDIEINYNRVKLILSTHDEGGVTEKDIDLAMKIDGN